MRQLRPRGCSRRCRRLRIHWTPATSAARMVRAPQGTTRMTARYDSKTASQSHGGVAATRVAGVPLKRTVQLV